MLSARSKHYHELVDDIQYVYTVQAAGFCHKNCCKIWENIPDRICQATILWLVLVSKAGWFYERKK